MKPAGCDVYANNPQKRRIVSFERNVNEQGQTGEGGARWEAEVSGGGGKLKFTRTGRSVGGVKSGVLKRSTSGAVGRSVFERIGDGKGKLTKGYGSAVEVSGDGVTGSANGAVEEIGRSAVEGSEGKRKITNTGSVYGVSGGRVEGAEASGSGKRKFTNSGRSVCGVSGGRVEGGARSATLRVGRSAVEGSEGKRKSIDSGIVYGVSGGRIEVAEASRSGKLKFTNCGGNVYGVSGGRVEGAEASGSGKRKVTNSVCTVCRVSGGRVEGGARSATVRIGRSAVEVSEGKRKITNSGIVYGVSCGRIEGAEASGSGKQKLTNSVCTVCRVSGGRVEDGARSATVRIGRSAVEGSEGKRKITNSGIVYGVSGGRIEVAEASGGGKRKLTNSVCTVCRVSGGRVEGGARSATLRIGRSAVEGSQGKLKITNSGVYRVSGGRVEGTEASGGGKRKFTNSGHNVFGVSGGRVEGAEASDSGKRKFTDNGHIVCGVSGGRVEGDARSATVRIGRSAVEGSREGKQKITISDRNAVEVHGGGEGCSRGAVEGIGWSAVEGCGDGKGKLTKCYRSALEVSDYDRGKLTKSYRSAVGVSGDGGANGAVEAIDDGKGKLTKSGRSEIEVSSVEVEEGAIASGAAEESGRSGVEGTIPPWLANASLYLAKVKEAFAKEIDIYCWFTGMLKSYKARRIDADEVITMATAMFEDYPDLIIGFNGFLTEDQKTKIINKEIVPEKKPVTREDVVTFIHKIKGHFGEDHHLYKSFMEMVCMYKRNGMTIIQVYQEAAIMFEGHPDFIEEFKKFLPEDKKQQVDSM